ncbi:hypothetical protein [Paraherbaspirillum soli]|uniref:Uncharacterized protein n=1 Tax=Paraherbaspirillum soli TaxID=631222 RepID=A0ABW0M5V3_9BURK
MPVREKLDALRISLTTISCNLLELADTETVKAARARLKDEVGGYAGLTRDKAAQAIKSLDALWNSYLLLARLFEQASDLNKRSGLFHHTEDQVRHLLEGLSVELRAEHIPITSRGLLSCADQIERATPQQVLDAMAQQFCDARDLLNTVSTAAGQAAPRLAALRQQAAELEIRAARLGTGYAAPARLDAVLNNAERDPLSCAAELERAASELEQQRLNLKNIEQQQAVSRAAIEHANGLLAELKDLAQRSAAAIEETRQKIHAPAGLILPVDDSVIDSLVIWLASIAQSVAAGRHDAVKVGLARWQAECSAQLTAARAAYAKNRLALDECAEINGRFQALRAKADALAARGAELDAALPAAMLNAKRALQSKPVDLPALRAAVGAYEASLRENK